MGDTKPNSEEHPNGGIKDEASILSNGEDKSGPYKKSCYCTLVPIQMTEEKQNFEKMLKMKYVKANLWPKIKENEGS